jgi:thymidylate synthase
VLTITATNVNDAFAEAMWRLPQLGEEVQTRNGKALRATTPVVTTYFYPTERMLFDPVRDANPFFHIFEGIWMLAGRNDVKWIGQFNSNIFTFSDNTKTFHGAYGYRWRGGDYDQIKFVIDELTRHPESRRAVMAMWFPDIDIPQVAQSGLDVPCNTTIYFTIRDGLEMTVCCRSNDAVWGCYGANAVHMSMLQEFVANAIGVPVGRYHQFSNDFHVYERHFHMLGKLPEHGQYSYTPRMRSEHVPLTDTANCIRDLEAFDSWIEEPFKDHDTPYIDTVLAPMLYAWDRYKGGKIALACDAASHIEDYAVRVACTQWLLRREEKRAKALEAV